MLPRRTNPSLGFQVGRRKIRPTHVHATLPGGHGCCAYRAGILGGRAICGYELYCDGIVWVMVLFCAWLPLTIGVWTGPTLSPAFLCCGDMLLIREPSRRGTCCLTSTAGRSSRCRASCACTRQKWRCVIHIMYSAIDGHLE